MKFAVGDIVVIKPDIIEALDILAIYAFNLSEKSLFKIKSIDYEEKQRCLECGNTHNPEITIFSVKNKKIEICMAECELDYSLGDKINKLLTL